MAKFGRFDPRNKKRDRNKNMSQTKDNRIRDVEESRTGFKIQGQTFLQIIVFFGPCHMLWCKTDSS